MKACLCLLLLLPFAAQPQQRTPRGRQQSRPNNSTPEEVLARFEGVLRALTKKEILIELPGEQTLTFRRVKKTTFYKDEKQVPAEAIAIGSAVLIEGRKEMNGDLDAIRVSLATPVKPEARVISRPPGANPRSRS